MSWGSNKEACVLVLGDFGRSPRMQYHAMSLAKVGFSVNIVAYKGTEPHKDLRNTGNIRYHYMKDVPEFEKYVPRVFVYILKTLWQSLFLFISMLRIPSSNFILLQNPPSIPTLPVAWFACWLLNCRLIIDFHNYGYTILGLTLGSRHILVRLCKWCEKYFARKAYGCFCVTKAMKEDLAENWNINATVFYDCPPGIFHPISITEKHELFMKLAKDYIPFRSESEESDCTRFTKMSGSHHTFLPKRPALLVSSTSWTEDEDFSLLLNAIEEYGLASSKNKELPSLVLAITGKGPLRSYYEKVIAEKQFTHVDIVTVWLEAEDYPKILASADLGICLHTSSSQLDLPMKVVDMFGSGLPVCAVSYSCIGELVKLEHNGLLFSSSHGLAEQLKRLLRNFPNAKELCKYQANLVQKPIKRWDESWENCVQPLLQELVQ